MNLLKEVSASNVKKKTVDLKNSDATDAGSGDVADKGANDISFSLIRNAINADGAVTGSSVANYLERAAELNDEIDTIQFGLETDDGEIVKVYVNAEQEAAFGEALKNLLGIEGDIEEAINRLSTEFDIIDVVWPDAGEDEGEDDLDQIDLNTALDDAPDDDDDEFEEFASALPSEETEETSAKPVKNKGAASLLQSITAK